MDSTTNASVGTEEILYCVWSNDAGRGRLWKQETGGVFAVSDRPVDYPTDTDAREAAVEYARTISRPDGLRTRVIRKAEQIVFDTADENGD